MIDAGAGAYVFISNQFAKEGESEDTARRSVEYLLDNIEADSFGVYECPYPYKRVLSPEFLKWLADTGKFSEPQNGLRRIFRCHGEFPPGSLRVACG